MARSLRRSGQLGQMTVEAILILSVFVLLAVSVSETFRRQELLAELVQEPWKVMAGMIENGVWEQADASRIKHPNNLSRHVSMRGEDVRR